MSSWTFEAKVDLRGLEKELAKWMSINEAFDQIGQAIEDEVKTNIETRRIIDTGALRDSINHKVEGDTLIVRDGVTYGVYNEFGTYKMAARPHFIPAVEKFGVIAEREFKKVLK